MNVMNGRGSLTGSAGALPRRRRRLLRAGAITSAVASAITSTTARAFSLGLALSFSLGFAFAATLSFALALDGFAFASCTAIRLLGPRTGVRGVKIQPTPGTGLPPTRRPSANSQLYSPWNSWNESLERTVAPVRSAICRRNPSPRPMAPAGGETMRAGQLRLLVLLALRLVDAVTERGIDHDDDIVTRVLVAERARPRR